MELRISRIPFVGIWVQSVLIAALIIVVAGDFVQKW